VPAEFVEHLFERYRRAAPNRGRGSGLGLAIVRDLARAQGGDAWYEPQEDRGAVFVVRLPAPPGLS
jgi:signal transduction histidine kinase